MFKGKDSGVHIGDGGVPKDQPIDVRMKMINILERTRHLPPEEARRILRMDPPKPIRTLEDGTTLSGPRAESLAGDYLYALLLFPEMSTEASTEPSHISLCVYSSLDAVGYHPADELRRRMWSEADRQGAILLRAGQIYIDSREVFERTGEDEVFGTDIVIRDVLRANFPEREISVCHTD